MSNNRYAWRIDHDWVCDGPEDDCAGTTGPSDAPPELVARLEAGEGHQFRMYDGDGELYYEGRYVDTDGGEPMPYADDPRICGGTLSEEAFGPLNDFGTPNAGAIEIRYRYGLSAWLSL